jgi:hypothetical protein
LGFFVLFFLFFRLLVWSGYGAFTDKTRVQFPAGEPVLGFFVLSFLFFRLLYGAFTDKTRVQFPAGENFFGLLFRLSNLLNKKEQNLGSTGT